MLITGMITALVIIGFLMCKYDNRYYTGVVLVFLSCLYLLLTPSDSFDLYRHYEIYDIVQNCSLKEALTGNQSLINDISGSLYNIYAESSPIYIVLLYLLSRVFSHKAIIVFSVFAVYGISIGIMRDIGKRHNISNYYVNFSCMAFLILLNFVDISGIRNTLAASLAFLAVYLDVCKKQRNLKTIASYIFAVLIHSSSIIVIIIRLLLLVKHKMFRRVMTGVLLFSVPLVVYTQDCRFSFGESPIGNLLNYTLDKFLSFVIGEGSSTGMLSTATVVLNIFIRGVGILAVYLIYMQVKKNKRLSEYGLSEYGQFAQLFFAFTLSCAPIYDMFVRLQFFTLFMGSVFLPVYMEISVDKTAVRLKDIRAFAVFACLVVVSVGYFLLSYRWIDGYFFK